MAELEAPVALGWPSAPVGLLVEPCEERPGALVFSFPLEERPLPLHDLTPAEAVVLDGVRGGLSNAEIARSRGVSVRTVANQMASLFRKLGAQSRLDLALLAARTERGCPSFRTRDRRVRRTHVRSPGHRDFRGVDRDLADPAGPAGGRTPRSALR